MLAIIIISFIHYYNITSIIIIIITNIIQSLYPVVLEYYIIRSFSYTNRLPFIQKSRHFPTRSIINSKYSFREVKRHLFLYRIPWRSNARGALHLHPKLDIKHSNQSGDSTGPTPLSSLSRALQYAAPQKGFQTCGIFIWNLEKTIFNPNRFKTALKKRKKEQSIHPTPPHYPLQPQPQPIFAVTRTALTSSIKTFDNESTLFLLVMVNQWTHPSNCTFT